MIFIRTCIILIALFLMPFVRADIDLHVLADKVREFVTQIEDPDAATTLNADADKLVAQPASLIQQIHAIGDILQGLRGNKNVLKLTLACINALNSLEEIPHEMLKQKARDYFSKKFPDAEIKFSDKNDGRQLGDCIHIVQSGDSEIIYHTKTHSRGLCAELDSWDSEEAEHVRLEELFVYKFFQYLGMGPEVHFFWYNEKDFYIATKDIRCTENGKIGTYTYEDVKSTPQLLGTSYLEFDSSQESFVKQEVVQGLVLIDIISRIFGLEDLITNSGNFFFIADESGQISGFKIIDFHISRHGAPRASALFKGFLIGSGPYSYLGFSDKISRYFLVHRDESARIEAARSFFLPLVEVFTEAIERSFKDIGTLQEKIPTLDMKSFEKYHQSVVTNVNALTQALRTSSR
ncbi:MAG: hypothetical protein LBJ78_01620 [Puniceicoccales bacterium]|jgi:hypothetical protein|nr:hypothetical protein [Puniceicoccales bacterium]